MLLLLFVAWAACFAARVHLWQARPSGRGFLIFKHVDEEHTVDG